jgi:UDP-3-O-[3-hydroxymyristoyl] glucosamine N-acyltransferase/quercetin dioxygenase-like cupin family protein
MGANNDLQGMNAVDRSRVDIRGVLICGKNVEVDTNVIFKGEVFLEDSVSIGPNCIINNSVIKRGTVVKENCSIESAQIGEECSIGPFARIRPGSVIGNKSQIGNFVEIKQVIMGQGCKINHHSFVGDCIMGSHVVMGAGSITCNHDGQKVNQTIIADDAYIGSGVQLIAPLTIGKEAFVGAGSTITENVPEKVLALSRSRQVIIKNWNKEAPNMTRNSQSNTNVAEGWKNVIIDDPCLWPKETRVVLDTPHIDDRGLIQSLVNFPVKNVSLITSKKGTVRSNHFHRTDWHYMYMLSGKAEYYCRQTGTDEEIKMIIFDKGDLVFTPPMEDHATHFLEDSVFLAMSRNPRDQDAYESDVIRIPMFENGKLVTGKTDV